MPKIAQECFKNDLWQLQINVFINQKYATNKSKKKLLKFTAHSNNTANH